MIKRNRKYLKEVRWIAYLIEERVIVLDKEELREMLSQESQVNRGQGSMASQKEN